MQVARWLGGAEPVEDGDTVPSLLVAVAGSAVDGRRGFDPAWTGAVVIDWDGTPLDGRGLGPRLRHLSALGVHAVVAHPGGEPLQDDLADLRPQGPGRLFYFSGDPTELVEVGPGGFTAGLPRRPLAAGDGRPTRVPKGAAPEQILAWAREWLLGADDPAMAVLVSATATSVPSALAFLDEVATAQHRFPAEVEDPAWRLEVEGFDRVREREVESWLAVANGRTGTRGTLEEGSPDSFPATYAAGVFGHVEGELPGPELVCGPEWTHLRPHAAGRPVDLAEGETLEHRRVLDLRQGILFRRWRQRLPSGEEWSFRSARFASLADRELLALEAEVTTDAPAASLGDGLPAARPDAAVASVERQAPGGRELVTVSGKDGQSATFAVSTHEERGRLERLVAVHRSWGDDLAVDALHCLGRAEAAGLPTLRARHRLEWRRRWTDADVTLPGDVDLQRAVRFALAHLISSGDPEADVASIGARGLTGPGYRGHVFWDTEVFVLPFFIWTHPPTARALLSYRHRTLPAARAKAAEFGYTGALFAWESADTGAEVAPLFARAPDGTRVEILTGLREHHISADVAWATWQYWQVTRDEAFLVDKGAELILETARFWASRAQRGDDGRFHIDGVIGPDEYHEDAPDNAFTNVLARWNLATAAKVCDLLPRLDRAAWEQLSARLDLRDPECRWWAEVGEGLVDGFDDRSLLYEQFAGFFALEDLRAVDVAPRPFPADTILGAPRVHGAQVVKQADVLMLAHMLPELVPAEVLAANYRYYEPRTSHGSSLSPPVHAAVAARVGALDDAERYFRMAATMDLDDRMGNSALGVHLATMGGLWQAAALGFGGVRADAEALRIDPRIPSSWEGLGFAVRWRGTRVAVDVGPAVLQIDVDGPATVAVGAEPAHRLEGGRYLATRQGTGWSALETVEGRA
jgi:trehalose/maltose hydrolase-like predicted phosphorylase